MTRLISKNKMSKKARKALNDMKRVTWGFAHCDPEAGQQKALPPGRPCAEKAVGKAGPGGSMSSFSQQVYALVAQVPPGKGGLLRPDRPDAGQSPAARQVGWAMRHCPDHLPWQRVVMADGSVTGGEYAPHRRAMLRRRASLFCWTAGWTCPPAAGQVPTFPTNSRKESRKMADKAYITRYASPWGF